MVLYFVCNIWSIWMGRNYIFKEILIVVIGR
jgi:hypothetical protein